jgi:isoamylase
VTDGLGRDALASSAGPGAPAPLGVTPDDGGVNVAIFSEHATSVTVDLFAEPGDAVPTDRLTLPGRTGDVWHGYLPGVRPGQLYGLRADGPYAPGEGHRFNPNKLLLDPHARAITGDVPSAHDILCAYRPGDPAEDVSFDDRDSAGVMPKCVVMGDAFDWGADRPPRTSPAETLIYECHVRHLTMRHPSVPPEWRGTYLGVASEPVVDHLLALGVTAVELLPVHHSMTERAVALRGRRNWWGYSSVGFFAPQSGYATGGRGEQVDEFRTMVRTLHAVGLEVYLDVVYNHTGEGDRLGPTVCFRGLDNASYYRLDADDPRRYVDVTGTGNSWNVSHPRALELVLDSLRYWVQAMHVDGFRFDLAPTLGRDPFAFDPHAPFFTALASDPVLSGVKLIAEPWDAGPGGNQQGGFPRGWSEWNGLFRDGVRRFWRGEPGRVRDLGTRLAGSPDLVGDRGPEASVNYVACHDGYTARDLVTYEAKHNEANGEDNRDGEQHNHTRNWGVEGPTDIPRIRRQRERVLRALLATPLVARGVPMLLAGDELGRTQHGNNNGFTLDEEAWVDWDPGPEAGRLLTFVRRATALRRREPLLRGIGVAEVRWVRPDGAELTEEDWGAPGGQVLGMLLVCSDDADGGPSRAVLVAFNGGGRTRSFALPEDGDDGWVEVLSTAHPGLERPIVTSLAVEAHALAVAALRAGNATATPRQP